MVCPGCPDVNVYADYADRMDSARTITRRMPPPPPPAGPNHTYPTTPRHPRLTLFGLLRKFRSAPSHSQHTAKSILIEQMPEFAAASLRTREDFLSRMHTQHAILPAIDGLRGPSDRPAEVDVAFMDDGPDPLLFFIPLKLPVRISGSPQHGKTHACKKIKTVAEEK